jgi:hypothetical protein
MAINLCVFSDQFIHIRPFGFANIGSKKYFQRYPFIPFNSKVKVFRATLRGVRDTSFFLFRLANIYA